MKLTMIGRILAIILLIGGLLHGYGSLLAYEAGSTARVWSLGSAAFAIFLGALCLHANRRPTDRGLIGLLIVGLAAWLMTVVGFGLSIGNVGDPRVLYHLVVTAALIAELLLLVRQSSERMASL